MRTREVYKVRPYVDRILDAEFRADVRSRCAALPRANGADEAALLVQELTHTLRADLGPRGFWASS